jgi:serine/threonine protein kinase
MAEHVGQQLGNYRLMQLLGQGNFSEVYLGEHIHLHTQAAIKVLYGQLASHDVEGFLNEARTLAHLRHPHIIQVLDFGVEGMTPFLVMDYAPRWLLLAILTWSFPPSPRRSGSKKLENDRSWTFCKPMSETSDCCCYSTTSSR